MAGEAIPRKTWHRWVQRKREFLLCVITLDAPALQSPPRETAGRRFSDSLRCGPNTLGWLTAFSLASLWCSHSPFSLAGRSAQLRLIVSFQGSPPGCLTLFRPLFWLAPRTLELTLFRCTSILWMRAGSNVTRESSQGLAEE